MNALSREGLAVPMPLPLPDHLLCMTLFNEPLEELLRSLEAVAQNLRPGPGAGGLPVPSVGLALVLDGHRQADARVLGWLARQGFAVGSGDTDRWQHRRIPLAVLAGAPEHDEGVLASVSLWLHVKAQNRGKLDSHAVFFETLCRPLQPDIVFQLDVGTTIGPQSMVRALAHFERRHEVAALSSRCAAVAPAAHEGFVRAWQFLDTASQLVTVWPTEQLCGQLSVIPGQFCALRWQALNHAPRGQASPLQHYLRGLSTASRFERTMFLAEDRVIGQALTLAPGARWTLTYGADVPATNDACGSLGELLRQRRRWNNGANACRLALLARWRDGWRRPDRGLADKLGFSTGLSWQAVQLLQQWCAPASWLCGLWVLGLAMQAAWARGYGAVVGATWAVLAVALLCTLRAQRRCAEAAWWMATLGSVATLGLGGVAPADVALMLAPQALTLALVARQYPAHAGLTARRAGEYFCCDGPLRLLLWSYALLRLGDVSWGTKGLRDPRQRSGLRNPAHWAVPAWLASNVAVLGLALGPSAAGSLPALLRVNCWVSLFSVAGGLLFLLLQHGQHRQRGAVGSAAAPMRALPRAHRG